MAHLNGRIFIDTSTTPRKGVEIADLQQVLGIGSPYLGYIIRNANIKKWAKYKPVRSDKLGMLTEQDRKLENYGLSIPAAGYGSIVNMIADLQNADWEYLRPRGNGNGVNGADEWFRIRDFEGYYHGAPAPIAPYAETTSTQSSDSIMDVGVGFRRSMPSDTGCLTLDDLRVDGHSISDTFSEYYFGVCLYYSDSVYFATTMSEKYKQIGASLDEIGLNVKDVAVPGSGSRTYRAIPFFASTPFTSWPSGIYNGTLYPIPFAECSVIVSKVADFYVSVFMYTLMTDTDDILYYNYSFVNPTDSDQSGTINIWALRSYNINDTYGNVIMSESRTVNARSSYNSQTYSINDGIRVRDILSNCPYVGVELTRGVRIKYSIQPIAIDLDPQDLT